MGKTHRSDSDIDEAKKPTYNRHYRSRQVEDREPDEEYPPPKYEKN